MAFFNPNIKLTVPNNQIDLNCDADGNLIISGSNSAMNVNLISSGSFEINGQALPTPEDIQTLTNDVNQINQNILTAGLDVFGSQPVEIQPVGTPPTNKALFNLANGSALVVKSDDNTGFGAVSMKDNDTLNIDCNDGVGVINLTGGELLFNGVPVGGGNPALEQCFSTPAENTFTTAPLVITSITDSSANLQVSKGGNISLQSSDELSIGSIVKANDGLNLTSTNNLLFEATGTATVSGVAGFTVITSTGDGNITAIASLNITGNDAVNITTDGDISATAPTGSVSLTGANGIDLVGDATVKNGSSLTLNTADNLKSTELNSEELTGETYLNISGQDKVKLVNSQLMINKNLANLTLTMDDTFNFAYFAGANLYDFSSTMLINQGDGLIVRRAGIDCSIRPDGVDSVINTSTGNFKFTSGDVYVKNVKAQVCAGGNTANRPTATAEQFQMYYDTDLDEIIFYQGGGVWKRYNGGIV